ncbi:MAG: hypothetical protein ABJ246_18745 [Paracoccaceae bacterium]
MVLQDRAIRIPHSLADVRDALVETVIADRDLVPDRVDQRRVAHHLSRGNHKKFQKLR